MDLKTYHNGDGGENRYRHCLLKEANASDEKAQAQKYRVVTINWTFATDSDTGTHDLRFVHRNEYIFTLSDLIDFIRRTDDVAEDIVSMVPLEKVEEF